MKVNKNYLIVMDEQGYYRLLRRTGNVFGEVVKKIRAESKEVAKQKFEELGLIK